MKGVTLTFLLVLSWLVPLQAQDLVITEFMAANGGVLEDEDGDRSDWIELLNVSGTSVSLAGWSLTDNASALTAWTFPSLTLTPNARLLVFASGKDRRDPASELHTNFKLRLSGEYLALVRPDGTTVEDAFAPSYPPQFEDVSYGRGEFGGETILIADDATIKYLVPSNSSNDVYVDGDLNPASKWIDTNFNDAVWDSGVLGLGYATASGDPYDPFIATDLQADMFNAAVGVYMRSSFTLADPTSIAALKLRIRHDDGFVAYLNGNPVPVASANAPTNAAALAFDTTGINHPDDEAILVAEFPLSPADATLLPGDNVLAIHGLNQAAGSSDALWKWELVGELASMGVNGNVNYFTSPSPGAVNGDAASDPGPMVRNTLDEPERPVVSDGSASLIVTADVQVTSQPIASVALQWRVMHEAEQTAIMRDDGLGNDLMAGDGTFTGTIVTSTLNPGEMLRWRVVATDTNGAETVDPPFEDPLDSPEYYGTVAANPEEASSRLPILHWFVQDPSSANTRTGTRGSCYFLGQFYDNILTDLHGQSTSGFPKKSYDFDFNKGARFRYAEGERRVKDINLLTNWADKSKGRNSLGYGLMAEIGAPVHFTFPVRVQQNGSFFSTADIVEDGDERYLDRVGLDENGALYKMYSSINSGGLNFEKKTRKEEASSDLSELRAGLLQAEEAKLTYAYDHLDIPALVNYMAARVLVSDRDHGHKNYYVYRDTEGSGEWMPLVWDIDLNWGRNWVSGPAYFDDTLTQDNWVEPQPGNELYNLIYDIPELSDMYLRRVKSVHDQILGPPGTSNARVEVFANELLERIDPSDVAISDAGLDFTKWGSWGNNNRAAAATARMIAEHLPGRREYIYNTSSNFIPPSQAAAPVVTLGMGEFNPSTGNQLEEYFTLSHSLSQAVDVSNWVITGGVRFTMPPGTVIPAGKTLHVARDAVAFRARSSSPKGGEQRFMVHGYAGQLSARGETLQLFNDQGILVDSLTYAGAPSDLQNHLRITEVNYHPADPSTAEQAINGTWSASDFEFVELTNTGPSTLNLSGAQFVDGITFTFPISMQLAPDAHLVVVSNLAAFQARYGNGPSVAGVYADRLSNDGETLQLLDAVGENVLEFTYNDIWYTPTDGRGYALVIRDPESDFELWDQPSSWAVSGDPLGTPGNAETQFSITLPEWISSEFTLAEQEDPDVVGPLADPDGDGVQNLLEYALGLDPKVSDGTLEGFLVTVGVAEDYLALRYTRLKHAADLTYTVEAGNDLIGWLPSQVPVEIIDHGDGTESVIIRDSLSVQDAASPRRFMRLRVTQE